MISGRDTLSSIDRAILGARSGEDRLADTLRALTDEAARLRGQQSQAFKALAAMRLDALDRDRIVGQLDVAERRALELLNRHREALAELAAQRAKATEAATAAETLHAAKAALQDAAEDRFEALIDEVEQAIAGDAAWVAQQARVSAAEAQAKAAADKAAQAEADRETKGRPYELDRLFLYLWRAGYGTPAYRAGPLVRFFDAKVARIVGYEAARPNYHMLTEIPLRLRGHADRLAGTVAAEQAALTALERAALEARGIVALERALAEARNEAEQAQARLAAAMAALQALDKAAEGEPDAYYHQAVGVIAEEISREDLTALYQEALRTPTPDDERIVRTLQDSEAAIGQVETQLRQARDASLRQASLRAELERSQERFRGAGYDSGSFDNADVIGRVIGGILQGTLSSRDLDEALKDGFRRPPRPSGGGWSSGGRSAGGRSGGFGGGGFRTGGGFGGGSRGGGGFRTGGGF